jgi:DNA-binding NarL/FixJ family response regulator
MIRERLAEVIQREPELTVCGEAEDKRSALRAAETTKPDLIIVDLTLKNSDGLDLIKDLRVRQPGVPILVVSMHDEEFLAERAIRAGAQGYITKQEATKNVLVAIRTVLDGHVYLGESMALRLASKVAQQPGSRTSLDRLSDRELRVFQLIGQGKGTRQIAAEMGVHITTVQTYRARIKDKLLLKNADDLRQQAIRLTRGTV